MEGIALYVKILSQCRRNDCHKSDKIYYLLNAFRLEKNIQLFQFLSKRLKRITVRFYLTTIPKTLVEIQNFTWIKRSNPISKRAGVHFHYNSDQFISFSSFQKDKTCELQNCFQYREVVWQLMTYLTISIKFKIQSSRHLALKIYFGAKIY